MKLFTILLIISMSLIGCASQTSKQIAQPTSSHSSSYLHILARQAATDYGIDHRLFYALIKQESAWNPKAISPKGARGLTQIMPSTGMGECGLERDVLLDPYFNLYCGAYYFSKLLRRFKNVELALAAYNSGPTRVARLGRVPRIRETQRYVRRIIASWNRSKNIPL
jgi:soluble lytic murein transglycosylase-like protein